MIFAIIDFSLLIIHNIYMKIKKNTKIFLILTILFVIIYIILASTPLNKEYQFVTSWTKDISHPEISTVNKDAEMSFYRLGQSAGYFTTEGEIINSLTFPYKITISDKFYATYDSDTSDIPFYNIYGEKQGSINTSGFPFFQEDRVYVFLPGGSSVSMFNSKGNFLWTHENVMPITAFGSSKNLTAIGYANGLISIIDNITGITLSDFKPDGSEIPVIIALNISPDGKYCACISGHNKQRFLLTEITENNQKTIFHKYLDSDSTKQEFIKFTNDNSKVIYVCEKNIGLYDLKNKKDTVYPIKDDILSMKETDNLIFLLGKTDNKYTVYIIEKTNAKIGQFSFEASSAFIQTIDNALFVGKDNKLSKIEIKKD